tara:strand:- start:102 stop:1478 length:1377 start_codon:yes stop_codon:yes gene_type:complete
MARFSDVFAPKSQTIVGTLTAGDLEVDSPTLSIDATNDRVGIGLTDPDSKLEVLATTTQQKWSYDADSFATVTVADASHTTIATGESGNLILDAAGDIELNADSADIVFKDGTHQLAKIASGSATMTIGSGVAEDTFLVFDGNAADWRIGIDDSADELEIGVGGAHDTTPAIIIDTSANVTVSTDLTVAGGDITYGNGQNATASVAATAHNVAGKNLTITAGPTTAGTTNNIAGGSLTLQAGQGKGSGAGGDIIFQTANAGGSGSSLNSLATALTISDDLSSTFTGHVVFAESTSVKCGSNAILSDSSGTMTLSNIDALDATTEATIESAIDTLSNLASIGTITTGVWNGTAIAQAYIAADAINGDKIADDAIDSEHYVDGSIDTAHIADNQVTLAKMAGLARGSIIVGNASGDPTALAIGSNTYVLKSDGTDIAWAASSGGVAVDDPNLILHTQVFS